MNTNDSLSPRGVILIALCMTVTFLGFGVYLLGNEERAAGWIMLIVAVFTALITLGMLTQAAKR